MQASRAKEKSAGGNSKGEVRAFVMRGVALVRSHAVWVAACVVGACSQGGEEVIPPSFERPSDAALACYDSEARIFVSSDLCPEALTQDDSEDTDSSDADSDGRSDAELSRRLRTTAFVTQGVRGELASVDLERDDEGGLLDFDLRIPGFTFQPIGEVPVAVATHPSRPDYAYVASAGSRRVEAVPTWLMQPQAEEQAVDPEAVALGAAPSDVAVTPEGAFLLATLPEEGSVVQVPVGESGELGSPSLIALPVPSELPVPQRVNAFDTEYRKVCPVDAPLDRPPNPEDLPAIVPQALELDSELPRPEKLVVDPHTGRIFVTDSRYPVIHSYSLDDGGVNTSSYRAVPTGVPVLRLALTPLLPQRIGDQVRRQRFAYAVDAVDRSVIAFDATAADPSAWTTLLVHGGVDAPDRLVLPSRARDVAVLTPDFGSSRYCSMEDEDAAEVSPVRLRGVFLAVALDDGTVRFVDIVDLDAPCRGGMACVDPPNARDQLVSIRAHRLRRGVFADSAVAVLTTPTMSFENGSFRVNVDGSSVASAAPALAPKTEGCPFPEQMARVFPTQTLAAASVPLLCAAGDPTAAVVEQWLATYEGALPGTGGGAGRFASEATVGDAVRRGRFFLADDQQLCRRGALGSLDVPSDANDPLAGYLGDQLEIVSEVRTELEADEGCLALTSDDLGARIYPTFFVERAYDQALALGGALLANREQPLEQAIAEVERCFPPRLEYRIASRQAYTVVGGDTGFLSRVVLGPEGVCVVDEAQAVDPERLDSYREGRALPNRLFTNPLISFEIAHSAATEEALASGSFASFSFTIGDVPAPLSVDLDTRANAASSVVTTNLRYFGRVGLLYAIDTESRGLVEVELDPFGSLRFFD